MSLRNHIPRPVVSAGIAAGTALGLTLSLAVSADKGASERNIEMSALPDAVASTFQSELKGKSAKEVEEISYEGIVVLYEAEYDKGGEEYEIYAYPNGEVAARHSHEEEKGE